MRSVTQYVCLPAGDAAPYDEPPARAYIQLGRGCVDLWQPGDKARFPWGAEWTYRTVVHDRLRGMVFFALVEA